MRFFKKRVRLSCSAAADNCSTDRRLFIRDRNTKMNFLVDTGADVSVIPRCEVHRPVKKADVVSYSVNGQPLKTYDIQPLNLNLNLRRELSFNFVIADVSSAILGADFLSHFGLIVDTRNKRLTDTVTKIETRADNVQ